MPALRRGILTVLVHDSVAPRCVARLAARDLPPLLVGGTLGVLGSFAAAWLALEVLRRADDAMGNFTEEVCA